MYTPTMNEIKLTIERDVARYTCVGNSMYYDGDGKWGRDQQFRVIQNYESIGEYMDSISKDALDEAYAAADIDKEKYTLMGHDLVIWRDRLPERGRRNYDLFIHKRTTYTAHCPKCVTFKEVPLGTTHVCPTCGTELVDVCVADKMFCPCPDSPARVDFALKLENADSDMAVNMSISSCCKATEQAITFSWTFESLHLGCGCGDKPTLARACKSFPDDALFMRKVFNYHLSRAYSGAPMYDIANAFHHLRNRDVAYALSTPTAWHGHNVTLAEHLVISEGEAAELDFMCMDEMAQWVTENLRPKWFADAAELRAEFARRLEIELI